MKFSELTQVALLGTERHSTAAPNPATPLGRLGAQLDSTQRERTLLSLAVLSGLHERAGRLPVRDPAPMPAPCAEEQQPCATARAATLLLRLLSGEFEELLPEWLKLAAQAGQLAPPEALPKLLEQGGAKPKLRDAILPSLGERGRWLAAQNPDWSWAVGAAGDDDNLWHTGERPARLAYLRKLRQTDAPRARELLAATWKEESPEDRAAFVAALEAGLCAEDQPFLEAALDDKRKEGRRQAAALLARIPGSALAKRMTERLRPLLRFTAAEPGRVLKLKKSKAAVLEVELPAECDKAMQRDGIEPKPAAGIGEKAWWLAQMLSAVPLPVWSDAWHCDIAEILAASERTEWKAELFEGWMLAAIGQRNADWAAALFPLALDPGRTARLESLLAVLPPERAEAQLSKVLSGDLRKHVDLQTILPWLCRHQWSAGFSRAILQWLRTLTATESNDWPFRNRLGSFASCLAPETLAEALAGWPTDSKGWEFWSKGVEEFLAVTQVRADLHAAFKT